MKSFQMVMRIIRPIHLLMGILLFALGTGIARYLGSGPDWSAYILGQGWLICLQLSSFLLSEYFNTTETEPLSKRAILFAAYAGLAGVASLTVLIIAQIHPGPTGNLLMLLAVSGGIFISLPPFKLENTGYGELLTAFLAGFLTPAFAFVLQTGDLHRLVSMTTSPLAVLCLAALIALEMPGYAADIKAGKCTLMVRMGWKNALILHNTLIISAYFLIGLASFWGLPRFVVVAGLLSLPVSLLLLWQIRRISQGAHPNWSALAINALAAFGCMAYFMTYAYWTH